uniref:Uncharacterized protein n=1 Tax=Panagrolaimus davidi TaxID=227884 RepID=A0A914QVP8_9BILA
MITHPGIYDVKLIDQSIKLRIPTNKCYGKLTVCYDSVDYESVQAPSICKKSKQTGFDLEIDPTRIRFIDGKFTSGKGYKGGCDESSVYSTGRPYIKPGYIITLNVIHASPYCSLIVRNASLEERGFIALPPKRSRPTPTMSTPSLSKPTTSQRSPTLTNLTPLSSPPSLPKLPTTPSLPKRPSPSSLPKRPSTPSPPSTSTYSTPLELTWYENAINSLRKPWRFEVSSADPPASSLLPATSTQLPPSDSTKVEDGLKLTLLQPSPTTTTTNSTTNGSSKKSQMTTTTADSLLPEEEALTQSLTTTNKKVLLEPHYASLLRNGCLGKNNSAKAREMRRQYPRNIGRTLQHREIKFFTLTSNEMFFEVDKMCKEAERDLKTKGIKFDEKKGITKMTENGRKFIESPKTPDFVAYFSFGAEYFEFIDTDLVPFCNLSIPLLFTISMIPRIDESKRRKALSSIRRQIPKIREQFSSSSAFAGYETMAFPINAIVKACEMSKNGVENLDKLLTMSRALMEDKTQRDTHQAADTRAAGRIGQKKKKLYIRMLDLF